MSNGTGVSVVHGHARKTVVIVFIRVSNPFVVWSSVAAPENKGRVHRMAHCRGKAMSRRRSTYSVAALSLHPNA